MIQHSKNGHQDDADLSPSELFTQWVWLEWERGTPSFTVGVYLPVREFSEWFLGSLPKKDFEKNFPLQKILDRWNSRGGR